MISKILISAFLFFVSGREIAYIDLTAPPKTIETGRHGGWVRGGGMLYHGDAPHPLPGTPTISLKLTRILPITNTPIVKQAVEVLATNTGKTPVSIPIGTDPIPLLKPTEEDRRWFLFSVMRGKGRRVGSAESASSLGRPETSVLLQPGDEVTFLLPIIIGYGHGPEDEIEVSVELFRKVLEGDRDYTEGVGEVICSENTLPLP